MDKLKLKLQRCYDRILTKCYNSKSSKYKIYGGRGIKMCDDWLRDRVLFYEWAIENGASLELSIDRIDTNGDYSPENCRWVDDYVQANNKRNNIVITHNNETKTLKEWCRELDMPYPTVKNRINWCRNNDIEIDNRIFDLVFKPTYEYKGHEFKDKILNVNRIRTKKQQYAYNKYYRDKLKRQGE